MYHISTQVGTIQTVMKELSTFSLPEWTILCRLRSDWWAKALSHILHLNGLSPAHTIQFDCE